MFGVLYPLVRVSRSAVVGTYVYELSNSVELTACACITTDVSSILLDSRPFFNNWSEFVLAAIFLPWCYSSYWSQFSANANKNAYVLEFVVILLISWFKSI